MYLFFLDRKLHTDTQIHTHINPYIIRKLLHCWLYYMLILTNWQREKIGTHCVTSSGVAGHVCVCVSSLTLLIGMTHTCLDKVQFCLQQKNKKKQQGARYDWRGDAAFFVFFTAVIWTQSKSSDILLLLIKNTVNFTYHHNNTLIIQ